MKKTTLDKILVIQDFVDVFPKSIPRLPPRRESDFRIELIPGVAHVSKAPYCMSVPELTKLKILL